MRRMSFPILCGCMSAVSVASLLLSLSTHFANPSIVTFDKARVLGLFVRQLSARTLSDKHIAQTTSHFNGALQRSISTYAARHHVVIVQRSNVLAGGRDITDDIVQALSQHMQEPV